MTEEQSKHIIDDLVKTGNESEWVEFKLNFHSPEEIGERISALANSACIRNQPYGYLVFGVEDSSHQIVGTTFRPLTHKKGGEDLEHWLSTRLNPRIDFTIHELDYGDGLHLSMFIIPAVKNRPVEFLHNAYIRIGTITRFLRDFPEKAAKIWRNIPIPFEREIALSHLKSSEVIALLSTETYFDLLKIPYPTNQQNVIERFLEEGLIVKDKTLYAITKLGAILFAKNLDDFKTVQRKSVRAIVYKGKNKIETTRDQTGVKGYALGFVGLVEWINSQLPANEEIIRALRRETKMYPEVAIRELVANALVHQDFSEKGFPMIEIYQDRIEISNPGVPLVSPDRFIDAYVSRNEDLANLMRRMGFCEEKGSGVDKVIFYNELYQLPPINVMVSEGRTKLTIYSYKTLNELDKEERVRACYQHACLKYVSNEKMTNQSLRERFKIEAKNAAIASRILKDTLEEGKIKEDDPTNTSRKYASYIPFWA